MNRDLFANMAVKDAALGAMQLIDSIQHMQPHVQMAALASTFVLLAEHWGSDVKDVFAMTSKIMNHADGRRPEFHAVRQYMEHEL